MNIEIYNLINKYGKEMLSQGYPVGKEAQIYLKVQNKCYVTRPGVDFSNLQEMDIKGLSAEEIQEDLKAEILIDSKKINALVISNTPYCARSAMENKEVSAVLDDMAQIIGPKAPLVNNNKAEIITALNNTAGCIVKDNYTITTGRNLYEAVVAMQVLEKSAEVFLKASVLGGGIKINSVEASLMRLIYKKKYSKGEEKVKGAEGKASSTIGPEEGVFQGKAIKHQEEEATLEEKAINHQLKETALEEKAIKHQEEPPLDEKLKVSVDEAHREKLIRELLVEYGRKLLESGLVQGTWGNLSIRLNEEYMVVTPSGTDYNRLTPQDMIKVNINTLKYEGTKKPTSEKDLHGSIYAARKEVGAVIHTHSKYCCIFAAAGKAMVIEGKEMEEKFGKKVAIAKYGLPGTKKLTKNTLKALGTNFGAIMANHGMICCGEDMNTAFENCLKLEQCGKSYIESRYE